MNRLGRRVARLARDERGATLATTAVLMMVLLGFVGLGLDVGANYLGRRAAQQAADAAAISAAVAHTITADPANLTQEARAITAQYGFVDGATADGGTVHVQVATPPTQGAYVGNSGATEVIVTRPTLGFFSTLFGVGRGSIAARAVALKGAGGACMLALNGRAVAAVTINGTAAIDMPDCSIESNSADKSAAMIINGSLSISVESLKAVGKILQNGTTVPNAFSNQSPVADPYAGAAVPNPSGCDASNQVVMNRRQAYAANGATPYVFCGGLTVNSGSVSFGAGTYVFNGGSFIVNGLGDAVSGSGVTFVLVNGASVIFNGAPRATLSAPRSGPMAGLLFLGGPGGGDVTLNGDGSSTFNGALYLPNRQLTLNGNVSAPNGGCSEMIADSITVNGSVRMQSRNCLGSGVKLAGGVSPSLVE